MARPLNKKVIQDRIKVNKGIMKDNKKVLTDEMKAAGKGEAMNAPTTRAALASFIKASNALNADNAKLASINSAEE